jgi:hypothetical protein
MLNNVLNEMIATGVATLTEQIQYYTNKIAQSEQEFISKVIGNSTDSYSLASHAKGLTTMRDILAEYQRALNELTALQPEPPVVKKAKRGRPPRK